MAKNILTLNDFKGKKSTIQESKEIKPINEMVDAIDDFYRVSVDVDLPKSLVGSFIKKVKESTGKDLRAEMGEKRLAERLVQWANENYLNIENLPVDIVTGSDKGPVQAQSQVQSQIQDDIDGEPQVQDTQVQAQVQAQVQPGQVQAQAPQAQAQPGQPIQNAQGAQVQAKAQTAAQQVPAQEI